MANYYCKYCGTRSTTISSLTGGTCSHHPLGTNKGKHALYEGTEKTRYSCKYCGTTSVNIAGLTTGSCSHHPNGTNKGRHEPTL